MSRVQPVSIIPVEAQQHVPGRAFCPGCGRKYAVPEDELKRRPGLSFTARCRSCGAGFSVTWIDDGLVTEAIEDLRDLEEADSASAIPKGARVGKYEIEERLAAGGSSTVYRAFDSGANRKVALKILHRSPDDADYGMRFKREVEVQGNLKHPNLMPIFDHGSVDEMPYYTMELLHKPMTLDTIAGMYRARRLAYNPALRTLNSLEALVRHIVLPVARAIDFANKNGVVHRDLKPGNIILDAKTLHVYVIDFGICHVMRTTGHRIVVRATEGGDEEQKRMAMGTVRQMPPEQARGGVAPQGDIWALGALLYYLVMGDSPVAPAIDLGRVGIEKRVANLRKITESSRAAGDEAGAAFYEAKLHELQGGTHRTFKDMLRDAQQGRYVPLAPDIDPALAAIVRRAMQTEPTERYPSAHHFTADLQAWLGGYSVRAYADELGPGKGTLYRARLTIRRNQNVLTALVAVTLLAAVGIGIWRFRERSVERRLIAGWMHEASRTKDPATQEEILTRVLARRPDHMQAQELLTSVRRFRPLLAHIEDARKLRERLHAMRRSREFRRMPWLAEEMGEMAAVLEKTVRPALGELPDTFATPSLEREVRLLTELLRGRRAVTLKKLPPGSTIDLIAADRRTGAFPWDKPRNLGTAPLGVDTLSLAPGTYILTVTDPATKRSLLLPFVIEYRSPAQMDLTCPIIPSRIPDGMVYVAGMKNMEYGDLRFSQETERIEVKPFFLDAREVTNTEYARYIASLEPHLRETAVPRRLIAGQSGRTAMLWEQDGGSYTIPAGTEHHPVTGISFLDARRYAQWAQKRLPRPEEFELAARGPDRRDYPFGTVLDPKACNADTGTVARVASFPRDRSPYGAFDLGGNVAEWIDVLTGAHAFIKGGAFDLPRYRASAAASDKVLADRPYDGIGFRCAQDVRPSGD